MTNSQRERLIKNCRDLISAYNSGVLGDTTFPEEQHPQFHDSEERLLYFTLPMALNYRRSSWHLWSSALQTYNDKETGWVFNTDSVKQSDLPTLQSALLKYKLALFPTIHTKTWFTICTSIRNKYNSISALLEKVDFDVPKLRNLITKESKKDFPFLAGPKIFNYWCLILGLYGGVNLKNHNEIEIAPDTHIIKCSVKLGVISENEANALTRDQISARWRQLLSNTGIDPIDMHPPLWFWSKNNFQYQLK